MLWSALVLAISLFLSLASPSTPATTTSPHPAEATQCFPHLRAALGLPSASTNLGETGARSGGAASTTIGGISTEYQVDADGFLVKKVLADGATWKYVWDAHGQLSEVERPDGQRVAFTYDAFGRRTSKTAGGKTTEYVWDGDDLVHERVRDDASGLVVAPLTTWVFEPGTFTPLAKLEGRKRYGVVTDHLGSPTMLATEAGKIAWRAQLDVYGVPREEPGVAAGWGAGAGGASAASAATANPWRFPGQYEDAETGLYYNRFRYYDPELGRYLSEDPIGVAGGVALFGYVVNWAVWRDVMGLSPAAGVSGLPRAGSALKSDPFHAFPGVVDNFARLGSRFDIPVKAPGGVIARTAELLQVEGSLNKRAGIFEWIVDQGTVTHRRFIPEGTITGRPNQVPGGCGK